MGEDLSGKQMPFTIWKWLTADERHDRWHPAERRLEKQDHFSTVASDSPLLLIANEQQVCLLTVKSPQSKMVSIFGYQN
ncbi:hypothetical protein [Agrobacterium sp. LAD9]|uniref:hypothetical protein n=1 Tax=Agrobacterium sp. LAD9 TaxID=2055153 RepID=UPI001290211F|nr:hypothetical protein [Agrobacterium sp. LAD9]